MPLHPELLMAAKRGDWRKLEDLMSKEAASSASEFAINVDFEAGTDERHCLSDSVLHVVASGGDGEEFLKSATVILGKAKHLLCTRNAMGDTPLHCTARAGSIKMVSHLIDLARRDDDDDDGDSASRVKLALRKENKRGETALHEAVRRGDEEMVRVLMSADAELARFPRANGASPLYLAVSLEDDGIAELLYHEDNQLSYSGPDGQDALQVAVLRSKKMTKKLLEWNENLIKQGDLSSGSTPPLHIAASWRSESFVDKLLGRDDSVATTTAAKLLLDAYELSAYQPDGTGSFPIHAAALANNVAVARVLLRKCPDCIHLRDAQGRTFLHIAAFKGHTFAVHWIVCYFLRGNPSDDRRQEQRFASIMNLQDSDGNTALHLAAMAGRLWTIRRLIWHEEVRLNLQNNKGQTALDLAGSRRPPWVLSNDPAVRIRRLLLLAGARPGIHQRGQEQAPLQNEEKQEEKIKESIPTIGVVSVLILTVSFASAFQLPGGYSTGETKPAGTPELATKYSFQAFIVANNLAASCSAAATISLMYAGM
ncbi:unnamed protein product [Urochloa humidicola]